ncbi:hypothetical protein Pcinc_038743 [Petrolisthes cinctipes]|uniref:Uncharacterized protein n=1 Tax=Petrolisthes cinctipes TaxID=88211 RepID=A0AAE1BQ11_PETCI|nr:hypothetical protein Pcinc_038743 [Petrolisthes cinctipes]
MKKQENKRKRIKGRNERRKRERSGGKKAGEGREKKAGKKRKEKKVKPQKEKEGDSVYSIDGASSVPSDGLTEWLRRPLMARLLCLLRRFSRGGSGLPSLPSLTHPEPS